MIHKVFKFSKVFNVFFGLKIFHSLARATAGNSLYVSLCYSVSSTVRLFAHEDDLNYAVQWMRPCVCRDYLGLDAKGVRNIQNNYLCTAYSKTIFEEYKSSCI